MPYDGHDRTARRPNRGVSQNRQALSPAVWGRAGRKPRSSQNQFLLGRKRDPTRVSCLNVCTGRWSALKARYSKVVCHPAGPARAS